MTTTKRILLAAVVLLATAIAIGITFHPDPGCGEEPEPTPASP